MLKEELKKMHDKLLHVIYDLRYSALTEDRVKVYTEILDDVRQKLENELLKA